MGNHCRKLVSHPSGLSWLPTQFPILFSFQLSGLRWSRKSKNVLNPQGSYQTPPASAYPSAAWNQPGPWIIRASGTSVRTFDWKNTSPLLLFPGSPIPRPPKVPSRGITEGAPSRTCSSHQATSTVVSVSSPRYTVLNEPRPISMSNLRYRPSGDVATAWVSVSSFSSCSRRRSRAAAASVILGCSRDPDPPVEPAGSKRSESAGFTGAPVVHVPSRGSSELGGGLIAGPEPAESGGSGGSGTGEAGWDQELSSPKSTELRRLRREERGRGSAFPEKRRTRREGGPRRGGPAATRGGGGRRGRSASAWDMGTSVSGAGGASMRKDRALQAVSREA